MEFSHLLLLLFALTCQYIFCIWIVLLYPDWQSNTNILLAPNLPDIYEKSLTDIECLSLCLSLFRGTTPVNGAGFGVERPAELTKNDDEYDAYRKRMMLAYRFRPNPLVTSISYCFLFVIAKFCESQCVISCRNSLFNSIISHPVSFAVFELTQVFLFLVFPQNNPRRPYYWCRGLFLFIIVLVYHNLKAVFCSCHSSAQVVKWTQLHSRNLKIWSVWQVERLVDSPLCLSFNLG